jgi:hypothetical protein
MPRFRQKEKQNRDDEVHRKQLHAFQPVALTIAADPGHDPDGQQQPVERLQQTRTEPGVSFFLGRHSSV